MAKLKRAKSTRVRAKAGTPAAAHRKRLFVDAYIATNGNATQAAIEAGYSRKTATAQGSRLLRNVNVSAEIKRRQGEIADRYALRAEEVLRQVACIVSSDPAALFDESGKLLPIHKMPSEVRAAIASVELDEEGRVVKVRLWDKNTAASNGMKHLGLFEKDNQQRADVLRTFYDSVKNTSRGLPSEQPKPEQ